MAELFREYQVFESTLDDNQDLPCLDSPWMDGPDARIPLEHWESLGQLAVEKEWIESTVWEKMSDLDGEEYLPQELSDFFECLHQLQAFLRLDLMLMLTRTADCDEALPGMEHARMLEAVIRVFELSGLDGDSYVEQVEIQD